MKNGKLYFYVILGALLLLFLFPSSCIAGAKNGLLLWFHTVLPTLFPFMLLSGLFIRLHLTDTLTWWFYPILHKLLGLSRNGCYPVVIGMLSGYPVGAKAVADLLEEGKIKKEEGNFLLAFCNNASPMFILEYMGAFCLGLSGAEKLLFLFIIYFSAVSSALLFYKLRGNRDLVGGVRTQTAGGTQETSAKWAVGGMQTETAMQPTTPKKPGSFLFLFDSVIMNTLEVLVKTGAYIIIFSLLCEVLLQLPFLPAICKAGGSGLLEITTGGNMVRSFSLPKTISYVCLCGTTAFGGFSAMAQTFSVIAGKGLDEKNYLRCKILNAVIAMLLGFVVCVICSML